jgi:DNA polymerase III epsilon subunit-like protein
MTSSKGEVFHVAQIAAHNAAFDGPFLQAWYDRLGVFFPAHRLMLCTLQRALWYFAEHPWVAPPRNYQLATLCHYFGVPFHAADAHEALGDVRATVGLYRALRSRLNELQQIEDSLADVA